MATTHNVKCLYCGMVFDAQPQDQGKVWFKPRTNRYAHIACKDKADGTMTKEQKEKRLAQIESRQIKIREKKEQKKAIK